MTGTSFRSLPIAVRLATMMNFFLGWVTLEELVIDRHHLDRFMPFYRVGNFCVYDFAVLLALVALWVRLNLLIGTKRA